MIPAPRETAQKWLAFGAIVVVAVGVSFASRACKSHLESTLPQPAPADSLVQVPPPPPTYDETDPPDFDGDGDDDAGAPPPANVTRVGRDAPAGTPDGSLRAKPAWAIAPTRASQAAYLPPAYAPLHSKPNEIFATASRIEGDVELARAFVICRGRDPGDVRTRVQLHLRSALGRTPMFAADGPGRGGQVFASAPLVALRKSDAVELTLFAYRNEVIEQRAHESSTFEGTLGPQTEINGEIECRALVGERLADRIAIDAARADAAIARLAGTKINLSREQWGAPNLRAEQAKRATSDVAALVGWDDPRAKKRVSDLALALALFDTQWGRVFDEQFRKAGKQTKVGPLHLTLGSTKCDGEEDDEEACTLGLTVKNEGTEGFTWALLTWSIASKDDQSYLLVLDDPQPDTIAPAETKNLTFHTSRDVVKGRSLAVFCFDGACGSVKLR